MRKIIDKGLELSLIFLMAFLVVDVLWQVLSRYILVSPSSVTDELAGYLLIWVGLLGAAYVSGKNEHLAIDLLLQHIRPSRRKLLRLFIFLIVFLFAVFVLIVGGTWLVYTRFHLGVTSASLEINLGYFFLLVVGVPVAYSIGVAGILTMLVNIDSLPALTTYAMRMASGLDSFALLAIPFFILAGNIMNSGGIALRLIDFAKVLVGRLPGGLAVVNVVANMLFGAISGSAAAAASAIGSIMTPEMKKAGYDPNFSAAVNISSATTGMTIPPSNVLIVYSLASGGVSVSALFMAGYLPGILTGVAIMIVAAMFAARKGYPVGVRVPFSEATRVFFRAIPSLMLLVIVIGGILAGLFTATEASAIAVLYALILSFIYKELTWAKLPQVLLRSAKTTAIVLLLVATCTGLSWIMSYENIPQTVSAALLSISDNPVVILILINVILLIVGIFMDMTPAVLIFTPIFLPIATGQLGMDPVHFGIMMVLNLCVGLCTPPVGSVLFIGCSVAGTKIDQVIRPLLPMFAAMVIVLFLVAFLPDLSLLIPRLFGL